MHWVFVILAGICEIGWAISSKKTSGFTNLTPMFFYVLFGFGSSVCLTLSAKVLPLAVAYGIWKGIALIGNTAADTIYFGTPLGAIRLASVVLILLGVIGLTYSSQIQ